MNHNHHSIASKEQTKYKAQDFLPLVIIFAAIIAATILTLIVIDGDTFDGLRLFMGYFFLIFGAFKIVNWTGFVDAYQEYDILAKRSRMYGYSYPLIELSLATAYLFSFQLLITNWITLLVMSISAYGVFLKLKGKEMIPCACLGTVFKIPMTWVTLIEDLLMAVMALVMIIVFL